ncbi:MAG: hypothetical protein U0X91_20770 [Spirosomataceae bacterium]
MSNVVDVSALSEQLTKDKKDYGKIFGLKMASGFDAKKDFVVLPIKEEVILVRDELGNITQPGATGATNFTTGAITHKQRIGKLRPAKVDLKLTELELKALAVSFLAKREPSDPKDINSLAGRNYIMGRVMARIGKEVNRAIVKGVEDAGTGAQGGLNLFDGLALKWTQGYATTGTGAVGDIPAGNKVASPASTVTQANILAEMNKMVSLIMANEDLVEYREEVASFFMPPVYYQYMCDALDVALSNGNQVVTKENGVYKFNLLPNTVIKPRSYMIGVNNMVWTPDGNFFYLCQDTEEDIPMIKFQEQDRDLKIFIDFQVNVDYADGRLIVLHK